MSRTATVTIPSSSEVGKGKPTVKRRDEGCIADDDGVHDEVEDDRNSVGFEDKNDVTGMAGIKAVMVLEGESIFPTFYCFSRGEESGGRNKR